MVSLKRQLYKLNYKVVNKLSSCKVEFLSTRDFITWTNEATTKIPDTIDVVCAVPRNGFLPASILCQKLDLPLSTPDLLYYDWVWKRSGEHVPFKPQHILLVDDSIGSGATFNHYYTILKTKAPVFRLAIWASLEGKSKVDSYVRLVHGRLSILEWHLEARYGRFKVASDLDGVLFQDGKPKFKPKYKLYAVITDRPEQERMEVNNWLHLSNIQYENLFMCNHNKLDTIRKVRPDFYIESDSRLASSIWKLTGVPTLAYDRMVMYS